MRGISNDVFQREWGLKHSFVGIEDLSKVLVDEGRREKLLSLIAVHEVRK